MDKNLVVEYTIEVHSYFRIRVIPDGSIYFFNPKHAGLVEKIFFPIEDLPDLIDVLDHIHSEHCHKESKK